MSTPQGLTPPPGTRRRTLAGLAALELAPERPRATLLCVPGFTGSKEDFLDVLGPLSARGVRVIAVDQPGQYETPGPSAAEAYTVLALGAVIARALAELGSPVHLLGHSFGGLVSRAAVLAEPRAARSLTLLGSGPAAIAGGRAEGIRLLRPVLAAGGLPAVWEAAQQMPVGETPPRPVPPEVAGWLRQRFFASSATGLAAMGEALLAEPDRVAELAATGVPVLVAHGESDDAWPPRVQAEMARRLGARYAVIAGGAHSPAAEAPEATAALLADFLLGGLPGDR